MLESDEFEQSEETTETAETNEAAKVTETTETTETAEAAEPAEPSETAEANGEQAENRYDYSDYFHGSMYEDARYVPAGESTVPPRYYTPPERSAKSSASKKKKKSGGFLRAACLALVCALLGGIGGSALTARSINARLNLLEQRVEQAAEPVVIGGVSSTPSPVASDGSAKTLAAIYDQACQQVVGITTEVTYQNIFGQTSTSAVSGSGFIISEDGYILTNYHVIEYAIRGDNTVTVMTHDGTRYEASIVGTEESNDIAVLKIDATGLTPAVLGNSDAIAVGDEVHAVGNPMGELEFSMTNGHVSALDRLIATDSGSDPINMFQIDAAVNHGNSGGPLYNAKGEVIGIVTAKYEDTGVEGLGFAIPINDAVRIAQDLITKGYVTGKAYLGVRIEQQYNAMYAQYYNMPLGAYVHSVESGSCAEKAGLRAGDIITRVGDTTVESFSDLKQALKAYSAGETAELELYRADESIVVTVIFDEAKPAAN